MRRDYHAYRIERIGDRVAFFHRLDNITSRGRKGIRKYLARCRADMRTIMISEFTEAVDLMRAYNATKHWRKP